MERHRNRFWKGLLQLADPKIWTASLVPFALGISIASAHGHPLNWFLLLLSVMILILVEISKNGMNEYYDYQSGADPFVAPEDRTPFSGGKKVIVDGILTLKEVAWISILSILLACLSAIPLIYYRPALLIFGFIGTFFAIAYSVPPLQLSYRSLGEVAVGLTFGPVIVNGVYFLQTARIDIEPILLSIPLGFLIANVLWINEIPDVEADRRAQKWNLVARLGRERSFGGYVLLFALAFASIVAASIILRKPFYLLGLGSLFIVPGTIRHARQHLLDSQKLIRANERTILIYLLTGVLLSISVFL